MEESFLLSRMTPYIGSAHMYDYFGGPNEQERFGNAYALHLFFSGDGAMNVNGLNYPVSKGTIVFVRPGVLHSFNATKANQLHCYNIYADLWLDQHAHPVSVEPRFVFPLSRGAASHKPLTLELACSKFSPELDALPVCSTLLPWPNLIESFINVVQLANRNSNYNNEAAHLLFHAWFLQWHDTADRPPADSRIDSLLRRMNTITDINCLTIDVMAQLCELGRTRFFNLFRQETGVSPGEYILRLKMKKATLLLRESGQSITWIAELLGYPTVHYFSNQFKRYYGVSPSKYIHLKPI